MGKERTHIVFAQTVYSKIDVPEIKKIIKDNMEWYFLGCIAPDIFYYSKDPKLEYISECLHGKHGFLTNKVIFDLAKDSNSKDVQAFIMGYITHCVLDMSMHPIINSFTGDYNSSLEAKAKHRQIETELDLLLSHEDVLHLLPNHIHKDFLFVNWLDLEFNIKYSQFKASYNRMLKLTKLFKSRIAYKIAAIFAKDKSILPLFYNCAEKTCAEEKLLPQIQMQNKNFLDKNIEIAVDETCLRVINVHKFILKWISVAEAKLVVKAENLDTGINMDKL